MQDQPDVKLPDPIEELISLLADGLPNTSVEVDRPADPDGEWWLDVACDDFRTSMAWRPAFGFGVFTSETGYNDRPDELYKLAPFAAKRLAQLITQWRDSASIPPLWLAGVRQLCETPQTALAEKLSISQVSISKLERREDMKLSTLRAYVEAMGGRLEIRVHFDAFDATIDLPPGDETP